MDKVAMYKEEIYKKAGVEYGYRAYKGNDNKLYDNLSHASLKGDYDTEDEVREKLKGKSPRDYGFPEWSEKAIANIPYQYDHNGIQDFMNGKNTHKLKAYKPLVDPYSGENNGTAFLAGRESAKKMVRMYDELLTKMPQESTFDQAKYDNAVKQRNILAEKIKNQRKLNEADLSSAYKELATLADKAIATEKTRDNTSLIHFFKRRNLSKDLTKQNIAVSNKRQAINKLRDKGVDPKDMEAMRNYRQEMYKATDRDIVEQYKNSLKNSLKDGNDMYEWGWS
jgi:hypothetical protein